jgi:hypothetical protein
LLYAVHSVGLDRCSLLDTKTRITLWNRVRYAGEYRVRS